MPDKFRRKTPQQAEKRKPKPKRHQVQEVISLFEFPKADWLPDPNDAYPEWAKAVERAWREYYACYEACRRDQANEKLSAMLENALHLVRGVFEHAYPPGF